MNINAKTIEGDGENFILIFEAPKDSTLFCYAKLHSSSACLLRIVGHRLSNIRCILLTILKWV